MTTSPSRRWLLAALFLACTFPLLAVAQSADLAFTITENSPDPVVAGQDGTALVYTITNNGPDDATNVVANLIFSVLGTITCPTSTDYTPSQGTVSIPGQTWTVGDIPSGGSVTLTESCSAIGPDSEDGAVRSVTFSLNAVDQTDTDGTNDSDAEDFTIERQFDLGLSVVDNPDPVLAGSGAGNLTHTFTLSRSGPSDASGVEVNVVPTLPAGVSIDSAVPSVGSWLGTTWTVGEWPASANGNDQTLTITLTVDSTASACTDCVSAEGTVSAASGTDTNGANDTAVDPTSIDTAESAPTSFLTTIAFTNGYNGMVTVSISCNNGVPLDQTFDISSTQPVDFVVDLLDFLAPDVACTISLDAVADGYVGNFLANGVDTGDACLFSSEPEAGEAPFNLTLDRENTCEITAEPVPSTFEVSKRWEFANDDIISVSANIDISCAPASSDTGAVFGTVSTFVTAFGDDDFSLQFYPSPAGTTCTATESGLDSAIESDGGCAAGTAFAIGDGAKGCTITNTVFFEGIPTLSQYGMALMALLMLGLGFVGLRRFV